MVINIVLEGRRRTVQLNRMDNSIELSLLELDINGNIVTDNSFDLNIEEIKKLIEGLSKINFEINKEKLHG